MWRTFAYYYDVFDIGVNLFTTVITSLLLESSRASAQACKNRGLSLNVSLESSTSLATPVSPSALDLLNLGRRLLFFLISRFF